MFGIGLSSLCLFLAHSSTSISVSLMASGIFHLFRARHFATSFWKLRIILVFSIFALIGLMLFFSAESRLPNWSEVIGPFASLFGKGTDLSQRTVIWQLVGEEVRRHPIMGLGYGAFWLGTGSLSQYIIDILYWTPYQSHNGYLDTINELGYIGLGFVLFTFVLHIKHLIQLFRLDRVAASFHLAIFVVLVISNYTESNLFRGMLINSALFIYSSVSVTTTLYRHRLMLAKAKASASIPARHNATQAFPAQKPV